MWQNQQFGSFKKKKKAGGDSTGQLRNTKTPQDVTKDVRIISMVKKNKFTTSNQLKSNLKEVWVLLSECKIKRHLHEIQTVDNKVQSTGYTEVQEDQIRLGLHSSAKRAKAKTAKATQEKIGQKKKSQSPDVKPTQAF